jgi:hypothetical protein
MSDTTDFCLDKLSNLVSIEALDVGDAFMRGLINRGINSQSLVLGAIGGAAFATAKCVSIVAEPILKNIPYVGEFAHQFTRGVIIRGIFTQNGNLALFGGAIFVVAEGVNVVFRKIIPQSKILEKTGLDYYYNQIPKEWSNDIFNTFHMDFIVRSGIKESMFIGLKEGVVGGAARATALIIKKIIIDTKPIHALGLGNYVKELPENLGIASLEVFIKGTIKATVYTGNPLVGLTNGIVEIIAFQTLSLYEAQSNKLREKIKAKKTLRLLHR